MSLPTRIHTKGHLRFPLAKDQAFLDQLTTNAESGHNSAFAAEYTRRLDTPSILLSKYSV